MVEMELWLRTEKEQWDREIRDTLRSPPLFFPFSTCKALLRPESYVFSFFVFFSYWWSVSLAHKLFFKNFINRSVKK